MVADYNKKQKGSLTASNRAFKIAAILALLATVFFIFMDYKIYQKKQQLVSQLIEYQNQIAQMQANSQNLTKEIANANDPAYIEKVAREQENMQKPGEKVVSFINVKGPQAPGQKTESFWSKDYWFGWIGQSWSWIKSNF